MTARTPVVPAYVPPPVRDHRDSVSRGVLPRVTADRSNQVPLRGVFKGVLTRNSGTCGILGLVGTVMIAEIRRTEVP